MAKEFENQTLREVGIRKKKIRKRNRLILTFLILAISAVGIVFLFKLLNRNYRSYEVVNLTENVGETAEGYMKYGHAVIKYTKDGAVAINRDGNLLWNASYEMTNPIIDTCDKFVVIADRGSDLVHIFNEKGSVNSFRTIYSISKVEIAHQGVVAVLLENGNSNYIKLFSEDGTELAKRETNVNDNGYPMDFSLSEDGTKLVTSFVSLSTGKIETNVAFFNFGEVGQSKVDRFVGAFKFNDLIAPRVIFLNNNTACIYMEDGFVLYSVPEMPKEIHKETFDKKIKSILYSDKYVGVILEEKDESKYELILYDLTGKKIFARRMNFKYEKVYLSGDEIVFYNNLSCYIIKINGNEKFEYTFDSNILALYPINHIDRYLLVNAAEVSEIRLKN